ncbi:hypothetical protein ACT17_15060 [Mycolicibacterium conceptionense]|uniref:VOC domain-containing protein n=1 Tax=Mycolicibacterium conceptionense TaxID=451644 RepID=A0A0J8U858_9MYCO|nr:VOC family protein [Mycolicibacterium conceptionense]KMV17601.1 hypothetical protein ACT17_15060 [Mycolicibacterium conceptionense]
MTNPLNLIVLYVSDLDASRRFYTACGLDFEPEKHGSGPLHFSTTLPTGLVLELYPQGSKAVTRTRLGFVVKNLDHARRALEAVGCTGLSTPKSLDYGLVSTVSDPDGNTVELVVAPAAANA